MISRLNGLYDNGGLSRGTASRCRQIRIWLHRAGRARSQKREMKFDRSDRDPLAPSSPPPPAASVSLFSSPDRNLESCKMALALVPRVSAPSGCPTGIDGHLPPFPPVLSRGAPHFIRFSFICYLPAAAVAAAGYAPSGHPLERVSLVPTRHLFTNTSHGLLALCRLSS